MGFFRNLVNNFTLPGLIYHNAIEKPRNARNAAAREKVAYDNRAAFIAGDNGRTLARYSSFDPNAPEEWMRGLAPRAREVMPDFQVDPSLTGPAREAAIQAKKTEWMAGQTARDKEAQMHDLISGQNQIIGDTGRTFDQYVNPQLQELEDARVRDSAQAAQQAQRQGWGSSSIASNLGRGVTADYRRNRGQLVNQNMMNRLNVMNQLKGKRLDLLSAFNVGGPGWQTPLNMSMQAQGTNYAMQQDKINQDIQKDANNKAFWASVIGGGTQLAGAAMGKPPGV